VVARTGAAEPMPGWEAHPVGLEELVLAYLQRSQSGAAPAYLRKELQP
jgi:ABC-2 type transport system ATP-binding protein